MKMRVNQNMFVRLFMNGQDNYQQIIICLLMYSLNGDFSNITDLL